MFRAVITHAQARIAQFPYTPNDGTQPGADPLVYFDRIDSCWEWDEEEEETRFNPRVRKPTGYSAEGFGCALEIVSGGGPAPEIKKRPPRGTRFF